MGKAPLILSCLTTIILVLFLSVNAFAVEYYIDPVNGNDSNAGTSPSSAFRSLGKVFRIGDDNPTTDKVTYNARYSEENPCIVYLMDGTFNLAETVYVKADNLTLRNHPGHSPKIYNNPQDGGGNYEAVTLNVWGSSATYYNNVTIDGIEIEGGFSFALKISEGSLHTTIRNCNIHGAGADCIKIVGDDKYHRGNAANKYTVIERCEIYNSGQRSGITNAEGIDAMAISYATIRNNYFHDILTVGMYFKGNCDNVTVENNFLYNVGILSNTTSIVHDTFGGIYFGECADQHYIPESPNNYECMNSVAKDNVIAFCGGPALRAMGAYNVEFSNNTVFNENRPFSKWYDYVDSGAIHVVLGCSVDPPREVNREITFTNNLIIDSCEQGWPNSNYQNAVISVGYGSWGDGGSTNSMMDCDHNIYYRRNGDYLWVDGTKGLWETSFEMWQSMTGQDANSLVAVTDEGLIAILDNPALPADKISSYQRGSAVPSNIGADVELIGKPVPPTGVKVVE